jgi:hypothetical protein
VQVILVGLMNEKGGMPAYDDIQGKVVYDLSADQKLSVIDVYSNDHIATKREDALDNKDNVYPEYKSFSNTAGINFLKLWGNYGYSNLTFSHTVTKTVCTYSQTSDGKLLLDNRSNEQEFLPNIKLMI